jgi:hypothetical protein
VWRLPKIGAERGRQRHQGTAGATEEYPALFPTLPSDQRFLEAAANTASFVGVNVQTFLALLSGFFAHRRGWISW